MGGRHLVPGRALDRLRAGDSVYVRAVEGGAARAVARLPEAHSCAWSPDGRRLACVSGNRQFVTNEEFGNHAASSVWLVPADGGAPVRVTDDEALNMSPAWLPGGGTLLYISDREGGRDLYQLRLTRAGRPSRRRDSAHHRPQCGPGERRGRWAAAGLRCVHRDCQRLVAPDPDRRRREREPGRAGHYRHAVDRGLRRLARRAVARLRLRPRRHPADLPHAPRRDGEVEQLTAGSEPAFAPASRPTAAKSPTTPSAAARGRSSSCPPREDRRPR